MPIVFFINVNGIKIHFLFFIYIIITIIMISKQLFIYLFIPLSPPSELSLLLQQYTFFCLFFVLYFFSHRVPSNLFQKLLLHIFEKRKRLVWQQGCLFRTGIWLSLHRNWRRMEVYQTWNSKAWYLEY